MNRVLKVLLISLGIGLIGYAFYVKIAVIQSPESARESALLSAARYGTNEFHSEFHQISESMSAGLNPIIVMGLAVIVIAAVIKNPTKP